MRYVTFLIKKKKKEGKLVTLPYIAIKWLIVFALEHMHTIR